MQYEKRVREGDDELAEMELGDIELDEIDDLDALYLYLRNYVQENNLQASVQVHKGDNVVYVRFMSTLFFEPNRAVLRTGGKDILDQVG